MSWMYRLITRNTNETTFMLGSSTYPLVLSVADDKGVSAYFKGTVASGTTYGEYIRLDGEAAGAEFIAGRHKCLLKTAAAGNAHGHHATLEFDTSAGHVTGLGTGLRGNVVVPNRAIAAGTYYGVMAEIYALGTSAALPAGSNACLSISCPTSTAMDLVANAISVSGGDGTGKMIYTHTAAGTQTGTIRILVNGVKAWIPFMQAE